MIKNLDTPKSISWRFWSRLMARTLPVNHKLSILADSNNKDNIYNKVYRDELVRGKDVHVTQKTRTTRYGAVRKPERGGYNWKQN